MTLALKNFALKNRAFFWDCADVEDLSESKILERTINLGSLDAIQKLFTIIGKKKSATIFFLQINKKRNNYKPEMKNLFKLVLKKYV